MLQPLLNCEQHVNKMEAIIEYLQQKYSPLGIIVYGSYADGSNNENSDFDVLVIIENDVACHDSTVVNGVVLDAFVCPKAQFAGKFDCNAFLQLADGYIAYDTNDVAAVLLTKVKEYIDAIHTKTPEENKTNVEWCEKMLLRSAGRMPVQSRTM